MILSNEQRCMYGKAPVVETICQIKFPQILTIKEKEPAEFQEQIRDVFPKYSRLKEQAAPRLVRNGNQPPHFETPEPTNNYQFLTADSKWKVNLTSSFIAFSTLQYGGWEEFAGKIDRILAAFIEVYKPAYFERIGLRYINAVSRKKLDLEDVPWTELINHPYVAVMDEEDVQESSMIRCTTDFEMPVPGGCRLKMHAGPGLLQGNNSNDKEPKFILDLDVSFSGNIQMEHTTGLLSSIHLNADRVFNGAVTEKLREAMEPEEI